METGWHTAKGVVFSLCERGQHNIDFTASSFPSLTQWTSLFQRGSSLINRCPHYLRIYDVPKIVHIQFDEFFYRFILTNSLVIIGVTVISLPVHASARTTNLTQLVTVSLSILIWVFSTLSLLLAPKVRDVGSAFRHPVQGYYTYFPELFICHICYYRR